jgi:parallel beta-helix repeat protein
MMWQARAFRIGFNLLLAVVVCASLSVIPAEKPVRATSIIVNSLGDGHDLNPADGVCSTGSGAPDCTLRAAVEEATTSGDVISFDSGLNGTISISSTLYILTDDVTIDGSGHDIIIKGIGEKLWACLRVAGNNATLQSLTIRDCAWGITVEEYLNNDGGNDSTIFGVTLLGNAYGAIYLGDDDGDGHGGVSVDITYSLIGAASPSPSSCIQEDKNGIGIALYPNADDNFIASNFILCNNHHGIYGSINDSNQIRGNTIAGNGYDGIYLNDCQAFTIDQNFIGNGEGVVAFGNGWHGIEMTGASFHVTIGGPLTTDANVISGNYYSGIYITGGSNALTINNNVIGINAYLDGALPNWNAGIAIVDNTISSGSSYDIRIGDDNFTTSHQYISGNVREGIYIQNSNNIKIKSSNLIGRGDFTASPQVAVGNGLDGVRLVDSPDVTLGAYAIAYNGADGVAVVGDLSQGDLLHALRIYANAGWPIDLGDDGTTPNDLNDLDAGPNTLLNYPVVTGISGGYLTGTSCSGCMVYFFLARRDPSLPCGGYIDGNLGSTVADYLGDWQMAYPLYDSTTLDMITMLSMDPLTGNTSELRPRPVVLSFLPLVNR